ncbi:hypothetical protein ACT91Q_06750 [Brevibacillus thermoruber]|uniref:hypothetical protein n=1 Tax=Brevibacillus thermoruber TaxID=33942 RepID=UPI0040415189
MALKPIPTEPVKVDGVRDTYVDLNPNTDPNMIKYKLSLMRSNELQKTLAMNAMAYLLK